jgi:hypothetical protein
VRYGPKMHVLPRQNGVVAGHATPQPPQLFGSFT